MSGSSREGALPYAVAILVTLLWSSSYVLIKTGLQEVPPLYFATLRYVLAFGVLAAASLALPKRAPSRTRGVWTSKRAVILAGICGYTVAQGFQYVGLYFLPAVSTAFILTFTPVFVLLIGVGFLGERAGAKELGGLLIALAGAFIFFYGRLTFQGELTGVFITIVSGVGWAGYVIIARGLQRVQGVDSLELTTATMGVGAAGLVVLTLLSGGYSPISLENLAFAVWLATANTALAFFLWNWALKAIPAYHLTVLQNIMLVEIAVFSFVFLGEILTPMMITGMAIVLLGIVMVQMRFSPAPRTSGRAGT